MEKEQKIGVFGEKVPLEIEVRGIKLKKMTPKLKKLNEIFVESAPCHSKMKQALEDWKVAYEKRGLVGDDCVIKFINWLIDDGK